MSSRPARLPRTNPEAVGISSAAILAFVDALETNVRGPHSFILLRHGQVAAEGWWSPYAPEIPHSLFSLSKSFASTAVGLAVSEGLLTVDDPVVSFFPDRLPGTVSDNLQAMRVRHLLSMVTGHDEDATGPTTAAEDGDWVRAFLALPVEHAPGSKFVYNSAATYMCSAIVQTLTGQTLTDYLRPRLFEPLGIENPRWERCPRGIDIGGWGLNITAEDIARFGQCLLQRGAWDGRQVIPTAWIEEATSKRVDNGEGDDSDWTQGYGYQFWMCRHGAYRGDGAFGQFCVVMPEQEMVVAMTGGHGELQGALDAVWDHLLPGLVPASSAPADPDLATRLAGLSVPAPEGSGDSHTARRAVKQAYRLGLNDFELQSVAFDIGEDRGLIGLGAPGSEQVFVAGHGRWIEGCVPGQNASPRLGARPVGRTAVQGAWSDADTYTMTVCYVETPFIETLACRFCGDEVTVTRRVNIGFGPAEDTILSGHCLET